MSQSNQSQRLVQIDILRGVAILLVLGAHSPIAPEKAGLFAPLARGLMVFGWSGVDLFFVLSGFLVGGLLFRELQLIGRLDAKRFIIRRAFKILPAYFVYVAFVGALKMHLDPHITANETFRMLLPNLLQVQNYLGTPRAHTWSLSLEEHFYLLLPLFLVLATRGNAGKTASIPAVPVLAITLGIVCLALRIWANASGPFLYSTHVFPTHLRIDALFFGVLLAYLYSYRPALLESIASKRRVLILSGLACIAPMLFIPQAEGSFVTTIGFTLLFLGYGAFLLLMVYSTADPAKPGGLIKARLARILAGMGYFSYGIYLWHIDLAKWPVEKLAARIADGRVPAEISWLVLMLLYFGLASAVGAVLSRCIEIPALALRDRWFPSVRGSHLRARTAPAKSTKDESTLITREGVLTNTTLP